MPMGAGGLSSYDTEIGGSAAGWTALEQLGSRTKSVGLCSSWNLMGQIPRNGQTYAFNYGGLQEERATASACLNYPENTFKTAELG